MYRKYYSYSDMPRLIQNNEKCVEKTDPICCENKNQDKGKFFGRFENDDVLLAVIIVALLLDDNSDGMLIIALAAVFLSGMI